MRQVINGTTWADLNNKIFRRPGHLPKWARAIIREQPGYRPGETMSIDQTTTGSYRLYVYIVNKWMDGSLADLPGKETP